MKTEGLGKKTTSELKAGKQPTEVLVRDKKPFTLELRAVTARLDRHVISPLARLLSTASMLMACYWLWVFSQCPVANIEVSESILQRNFAMDYGSEVAFLCFGFLYGLAAMVVVLYLARFLWNIGEAWLKKWLSDNLNLLLRYLVLMLVITGSVEEIPRLKTMTLTYASHMSVMVRSVLYKTQNRASNFADFVRAVK
ncbi:MAG: hypothetical protein ACAI44_33615 [Candidatus Sericytochromatia bacterium]